MGTVAKQEQLYRILGALSQMPGAYSFTVIWRDLVGDLRKRSATASEYQRAFMAAAIPTDIQVAEDAVNCFITFFGARSAVKSDDNLGDQFAALCQSEGMSEAPNAMIDVKDSDNPNAAYTVNIRLWELNSSDGAPSRA